MIIMYSACPYAISFQKYKRQTHTRERLTSRAKDSVYAVRPRQQSFKREGFTGSGVQPANELVKMYLGLVGEHAGKSFMDM